jgi:pimeloyl-ACP methyl ester carboxylesterase
VTTAVVNGVRLNYSQTGGGPDVVMVHGLATNLAFWYLKSVPFLRKEFRVTAYDLRGHGRSEMTPSGYGPSSMADDLQALLDRLGIDRVHLVGHSYGGVVALEYVLRAPARVASLTIVDTRLDAFQPTLRLKDWPHFETWKKQLQQSNLQVPDPEAEADYHLLMHEQLADRATHARSNAGGRFPAPFPGRGRRAAQQWVRVLESTTAKADLGACGPSLERVQQLVTPTLAIFGALSHCLPSGIGLRSVVGCHAVIIPDAGHFFPFTRSRAFTTVLREFLLRVSRRDDLDKANSYGETVRTV